MRLSFAVALIGVLVGAADGQARDFCPNLHIPEELGLLCQTTYGDGTAVTVVEAPEQAFPGLNRLRIRALDAPVDDPATWLTNQVSLDLSAQREALDRFAEDPDNPFNPQWLGATLDSVRRALGDLESLAQAPCSKPDQKGSDRWSLRCTYHAVLIEQTLYLELRDPAGEPLAIDYRVANPKRGRHFEALINGLEVD